MRDSVSFTHLATGKSVVVVKKSAVSAVFVGDFVFNNKTTPGATWILLENVRDPIPVQETEAEVMEKLGLTTKES